ncbi:H/ACA ribonucleoprotein complex subunit 2-like protein [Tanacetum coccineum]
MGGSDSEADKSALKEKKKLLALAPIAKPLAGKKLSKRTLKLVRKAAEHKCLKRGVKEVVKSIRRGNKGTGLNDLAAWFLCLLGVSSSIRLMDL